MSARKWPADDTSVPVDLLGMLLHSLEEELPRALELRERLHMIPETSHSEHATSGLVAVALGTGSVEAVASTGLLARVGPSGKAVSDDFGFYGRLSPTLMLFVGLKNAPGTPNVPLHHPRFLPTGEAVGAVARAQAVAFTAAATDPRAERRGSNALNGGCPCKQ